MDLLKVVANEIKKDITSRTAAAVRTANPGEFATDSDVPVHLYTCLKDMFGYSTNTEFYEHIIDNYGSSLGPRDSGIELSAYQLDGIISGQGRPVDSLRSKFSYLTIFCRQHPPIESGEDDLMDNAHLRLEYILDSEVRVRTKSLGLTTTAKLDPTGIGKSLRKDYGVELQYMRQITDSNTQEEAMLWRAEYVVYFLK